MKTNETEMKTMPHPCPKDSESVPSVVNMAFLETNPEHLVICKLRASGEVGWAFVRLQDLQRFVGQLVAQLELAGRCDLIEDTLQFAMHGHTKPNLKKYEEAA
jgi:hypothetical protein